MQMENPPLISIITLNWNTAEATCQFLESTRKFSHKNYEVLVCDMDSEIDPTGIIEHKNFPNTRVLRSRKNLGFAGGNNWGMKQAKGDYVFIVNNDTEVTPDLLNLLLDPFLKNPDIGVVCPKIKYFISPNVIQYAGFKPMNFFTARTTAVGSKQVDNGQFDKPGYTAGAHGCAMMVKREVIDKTGMFPESFFLYYEEWDWSCRIKNAGYKIYYQSNAVIYHKESMSVGKENPLKVYYLTRNRILFIRRNSNWLQCIAFIVFFLFFSFPKSVIMYASKRQFNFLNSFLRGAWNGIVTTSYSIV